MPASASAMQALQNVDGSDACVPGRQGEHAVVPHPTATTPRNTTNARNLTMRIYPERYARLPEGPVTGQGAWRAVWAPESTG
jgi:hypothetical protein